MTSDRQAGHDGDAALEREAIVWLTRVTDEDATREDRAALRRWQAQSPVHAAAYAKASKLWRAMPSAIETMVHTGDLLAPDAVDQGARLIGRRAVMGGFAAATAAAAGYLMIRPPFDLWPSLSALAADYRTGTGQQRRITIAATQIEMNTRTSIALQSSTPGFDRFELISGEVMVGASAGSAKPVQVIAADGQTTANGADFDIRCEPATVAVTCLTGTVQVDYGDRSIMLQQRQQVSYGGGVLSPVALVDPAVVICWRDGYLMFRREPLAQVIAEVNRYRPGRIVLLNATLGRGLVTARFKLDRLDDVIAQVQDVFGATVRTLPGGVVLLS